MHGIHGTQDPNLYVLQNCMNCSKQDPTHPLLIKYTGFMGQLLSMHFASHKCHFVQPEADESITFCQCGGYKHAVFIPKQQLQFSALSAMFSEVLLWKLHPPLLRNQSVKTYGKRQCSSALNTMQSRNMSAHLYICMQRRGDSFCYTNAVSISSWVKVGSIWQAGSLLLARSFACKMSQFSLFRDDCI